MSKTAETQTATMADINGPTPDNPKPRATTASEKKTVAPSGNGAETAAADTDESVAETARKVAAEKAEEAKDTAAAATRAHAQKLRDAGDSFDAGTFAHAATERLADNLTEAARSLRGADLNNVADDVTDFARRQPLVFFGGAALLGFAAARMLKASERAEHDTHGSHAPEVS